MSATCPPLDQLEALLAERLGAAEAAALEAHLAGCAGCQGELDRLSAAADPAPPWLRPAAGTQPAPVADLVRRLEASPPPADADDLVGREVGPYAVEALVGQGGFGAVYRARRCDGLYDQTVALKVLREGRGGAAVLRRFRRERQALAGLEGHPHIVSLFDAGLTADGRPYFVMEYVAGRRLDRYCDERQLGVRERLGLFLQVCAAVQHAHRSLVLHRDLKPANILAADGPGGQPAVKLLDFGIAKSLAGEPAGDDEAGGPTTQPGDRAFTPAYASPEQVRGGRVDVTSDVYSLGVVLYELLCGRRPYRFGGAAVEEVVCRQEPEPPSARVGETETVAGAGGKTAELTPVELGRRRSAGPRQLRRQLRGDLDNICLKALQKEPARRYPSVEALARDVRAYLAGDLVAARGSPWGYRAGKLLRKHRGKLALAALALVAALAAGGLWLERARQQGRREAAVARALERAGDLRRAGRWAEAEAVLEQAHWGPAEGEPGRRLEQALRDLRLAQRLEGIRARGATLVDGREDRGRAAGEYAEAFRAAGLGEEGEPAEEVAARVRASAARAALVAALDDWAVLTRDPARRGWLLAVARGAAPDSEGGPAGWSRRFRDTKVRRDRAALQRLVAEADVRGLSPQALYALAVVLGGRGGDPLPLLRAAHDEHPADFWLALQLGSALSGAGRFGEAEAYFRAARGLRPDSPLPHNNLGAALAKQAKWEGAAASYRRALALDPNFPPAHTNLGAALKEQGMLAEAVASHRRALAKEPTLAAAHANLGLALLQQGKLAEAVASYRRALELNPGDAKAHDSLGAALSRQGRHKEAEAAYRAALRLQPDFPQAHYNLGAALADQGRYPEAEAAYRAALRLQPDFPQAHNNLGAALSRQGRHKEAEAAYRAALRLRPDYPEAHNNLGAALLGQGRPKEAEAACRDALRLKPDSPKAHNNLGNALRGQGRPGEALCCYLRALDLDPSNALGHNILGAALAELGRLGEASRCYHRALELDPRLALAYNTLGAALRGQGRSGEALCCHLRALELDPKDASAHNNLGTVLRALGRLDEASRCFRTALELDPGLAAAHFNLGLTLGAQGRPDEAARCYGAVIALDPRHANAHGNLGLAERRRGRFAQALCALRRGRDVLGPADPRLHQFRRQIRETQLLAELDGQLPAILAGKAKPAGADERLTLAGLCGQPYRRLYAAAARLYAEAFAERPALAARHRYDAACAAALAGCGQGEGGALLDEKGRARLRGQALGWLRADLARWRGRLAGGPPADRGLAQRTLRHWQHDPDLAGVRDEPALGNLPAEERAAWQKLWAEVDDLLRRAGPPR